MVWKNGLSWGFSSCTHFKNQHGKDVFFFHMLTSRRACQSLDSEHQHVQLFTWTYDMVTVRMVTKPFMITIFHGNCFWNNDIRMVKWYHARLDYMGRFVIQEKDWVNCFIHIASCSAPWFMQWHLVCLHLANCRLRNHTCRIIPVSKWLVTPIYQPFSPFGRGINLHRELTNHGY